MAFRVFDPSPELPQELLGRPFFETPLAFFQEQVGVVLGDSVVFPEVPFRLVPGVFDPLDVVVAINETFLVVDPNVTDVRNSEGVAASPAVRVGDAARISEWRGLLTDGISVLASVGIPGLIRAGLSARQR